MKVSVSFLKNNEGIEKTLEKIDESNADSIHVDVADGTFTDVVNVRKDELILFKNLKHKLDVHLMCSDPTFFISEFAKLNTEYITVHLEIDNVYKCISLIKLKGIKCGLALKPETNIDFLVPYLPLLDKVIILGVTPGMGGAKLIESTISKINELIKLRRKMNLKFDITFDGGVNADTIKKLRDADTVVSGSFVVMSDNYNEQINLLRQLT